MVTVAILIKVAKKSWKLWKYFVYKSCILDKDTQTKLFSAHIFDEFRLSRKDFHENVDVYFDF